MRWTFRHVLLGAVGLAAVLTVACGGDENPAGPTGGTTSASAVVDLTAETFGPMVLDAPGPIMVEFYGSTCSHCRTMAPIVEELARQYQGRVPVTRIEVQEARQILDQEGVTLIPTFVTYRHGRQTDRQVGETSYASLAGMLDAALASQ